MSVLNVAEPAYMADDELRMFRDSVARFFTQHAPPERSEEGRLSAAMPCSAATPFRCSRSELHCAFWNAIGHGLSAGPLSP